MQEQTPRVRAQDLSEAKKLLKELRDLKPVITYRIMARSEEDATVWTFSDSSFKIVSGRDYAQTRIITGFMMTGGDGKKGIQIEDEVIIKQRLVA